jgi:ubiquinone/menaquinone biosynthesis C-methylase UbiE
MPAKGIQWIGVEPNRYMHPHLRQEAHRLGINIDLRLGTAENLPLESASVDFAVSTLALCSVVDQKRAVREILRVLKPGGRFVFIEHVAAPTGTLLRRIQTTVKPVWRRLGDGCHPDRQTRDLLEGFSFAKLDIAEFIAPLPIVSPHIAGSATKA